MVASLKVIHGSSSGGGIRYYLELVREDYYTEGGEKPGRFLGKGAKELRLFEPILHRDQRLKDLYHGLNPNDGSVLRQGATTERVYQTKNGESKVYKPVAAYDFTLSADKTVSVLWGVCDSATRERISKIHAQAVQAAASYIEENLCYTRVRTEEGGYRLEKIKPIFAAFQHSTSRELDPQLHTHLLLLNTGLRLDGSGGAIHGKTFLQRGSPHLFKMGEIYHTTLRQGLEQELGVQTYEVKLAKGKSVAIAGVPPSLAREFSKRRRQIAKEITKEDTAKQKQVKVLATRKLKMTRLRQADLFRVWQQIARERGFDYQTVLSKKNTIVQSRPVAASQKRPEQSEVHSAPLAHPTPQAAQAVYSSGSKYQQETNLNTKRRQQRLQRSRFQERFSQSAHTSHKRDSSSHESMGSTKRTQADERAREKIKCHARSRQEQKSSVIRAAFERSRVALSQQKRYRRKIIFLYATHKINRRTYLRLTEGRGLPKTKLGIDLAYAVGQIRMSQRMYLYYKYGHGIPRGIPRSRLGINLAYATRQITNRQRRFLLGQRKEGKQQVVVSQFRRSLHEQIRKLIPRRVMKYSTRQSRKQKP